MEKWKEYIKIRDQIYEKFGYGYEAHIRIKALCKRLGI